MANAGPHGQASAMWRESTSVEFGIKSDSDLYISGVKPGRKNQGPEERHRELLSTSPITYIICSNFIGKANKFKTEVFLRGIHERPVPIDGKGEVECHCSLESWVSPDPGRTNKQNMKTSRSVDHHALNRVRA